MYSGTQQAAAIFTVMDCILPAVQQSMGELVQASAAKPKLNRRKIRDKFYSATASRSA
jgi:hypothetical protein